MIVSCIAAMSSNRVIGANNDLIWNLPDDMKFFSTTTKGHHILMGRKNFESIPEKYRPLPKRENIVLTRNTSFTAAGIHVYHKLEKAVAFAKNQGEEELFIIGGGEIYQLALEAGIVDRIYLTELDVELEGDAYFPRFDQTNFTKTVLRRRETDAKHHYAFTIYLYERNKK